MKIRLHHADGGFDLVPEDEIENPDQDSLGVYEVQTRDGAEKRHKVTSPTPYTDLEIPDDYAGTPIELTQLVQTLTERHSPEDKVTGVSGDNARIVAKLAALLDADVLEDHNATADAED